METYTIKIDKRTKVGKAFLQFVNVFLKGQKGVEIHKNNNSHQENDSPYDPEFVKKIRKSEKEESVEIDPNNVWGSLGLK